MQLQLSTRVAALPRTLPQARGAVATLFFVADAGFANWVVRIPDTQARLGLGEGALGTALLGIAAGALVGLPIAGRCVARLGSRPVAVSAVAAYAASLVLPALAPSPAALFLALFALGASNGALDVSMNAAGAAVERRWRRPIMASFHGAFSLGTLAGAAGGGAVAAWGVTPLAHLLGVGVGLAALGLWASGGLLPAREDGAPDAPAWVKPPRELLPLGALAFCALFVEGLVNDWSSVYLAAELGQPSSRAALGFGAFSTTMLLGRFLGDALAARWGSVRLVAGGGATAVLGFLLVLWTSALWIAAAGFALVGLGVAATFPLALSAASRARVAAAGTAIAAVSTVGYTGFLVGPPLVGFAADAFGLRAALGFGLLAAMLAVVLARAVRQPGER